MGTNSPPRCPQRAKRTRSRTGCWTCREAGYKCDEIKPECGRCTRLSIHCKGYGLRLKWQSSQDAVAGGGRRRRSTGTLSSPANPARGLSLRPSDMTLEQYRLLHHWTVHTSPLLCISGVDQTNPFQMYLTPMSMCDGSRPLRHAVLSIAASHLTAQEADAAPWQSYALMAQNYRITAISSLRDTLGQGLSSDATLATILLLEISKQFDDTSVQYDGDINHLIGAKELIVARGGPQSLTSPCARFLLNQVLYHDLLSAVSRGSEPLIRQYWPGLENAPLQLDLESSRGYHPTILHAVAQISELKTRKEMAFSSGQDIALAEFTLAGQGVEVELEAMNIPVSTTTTSDQTYTTEAHRSAALIYLYRVIFDIGAPHPLTLSQVRRCIDAMASVPASSPLLSAHVWPLFTAGCEATEPRDREFVNQRLMDMYRQRRIRSLRKVCELMERVWLSKDYKRSIEGAEEMSRVGCIEVVRGLGEMLYLV
ncbi:fungal-specific transcription factor domain-containing protein [Aspergillus germanicus]